MHANCIGLANLRFDYDKIAHLYIQFPTSISFSVGINRNSDTFVEMSKAVIDGGKNEGGDGEGQKTLREFFEVGAIFLIVIIKVD